MKSLMLLHRLKIELKNCAQKRAAKNETTQKTAASKVWSVMKDLVEQSTRKVSERRVKIN